MSICHYLKVQVVLHLEQLASPFLARDEQLFARSTHAARDRFLHRACADGEPHHSVVSIAEWHVGRSPPSSVHFFAALSQLAQRKEWSHRATREDIPSLALRHPCRPA